MSSAVTDLKNIEVTPLKTKYPQGAEKTTNLCCN